MGEYSSIWLFSGADIFLQDKKKRLIFSRQQLIWVGAGFGLVMARISV